MILIYSNNCKHCNVLLETIKKHDSNNIIKKVSLDTLRNKYKIENVIDSVPALILNLDKDLNKDDIIYGKQVFDHLLLPNRGALFNKDNNTRLNNNKKDSINNISVDDNDKISNNEPLAFSLGLNMSDNFSSIDDTTNASNDKQYAWQLLDDNNSSQKIDDIIMPESTNDKNLPSIEELLSKRSKDLI
jgi:hypothetical protein